MNKTASILILLLAAGLEAGGDALVRTGLHSNSTLVRSLLLFIGAVVLLAYGCAVNAPPWDFGKLLGLYVVFFFLIAQVLSYFTSGQAPSRSVLIGGILILAGGIVISIEA